MLLRNENGGPVKRWKKVILTDLNRLTKGIGEIYYVAQIVNCEIQRFKKIEKIIN